MTESTAARVRSQVLASKDRFWRATDFTEDSHAVVTALKRLVDKGELKRIRRDLYWRGRKTRFGMTSPDALQVLEKVVGADVAVGATGWHASNLLGLSTQVVPEPMFAVSTRIPAGLSAMRLVDRSARTGRNRAQLTPTEVTFLEALDGWDSFVELDSEHALTRFSGLLEDENCRVDRLVEASSTESAAVRERLRAVLEHAGKHEAAEIVPPARSDSARDRAQAVLVDA
jgi:hypothetical protein